MPFPVFKDGTVVKGALAAGQTIRLGGFLMTACSATAPTMTSQVIKSDLHISSEFAEQVRGGHVPSDPVRQRISRLVRARGIHNLPSYTLLWVHEAQNARTNGIITLASDPDTALRAENKTAALALEALSEALAAEELTALRSTVNRDDVILDKRSKSTSLSIQRTLQKRPPSGHN